MAMKQVLLFAQPFFGYEKHIASQIKKQGYIVHTIDGRKGWLLDFFLSFSAKRELIYQKYIEELLQSISLEQIDIFLAIKGDGLTTEHLRYIKQRSPHMRLLLYEWDSLNNFDYSSLIPFFDKVMTFDFKDAKDFSLNYLPLFYTEDINPEPSVKEDIDIFMIGTFLQESYNAMLRMKSIDYANGLKMKSHIFVAPSFFIRKQIWGRNKLGAKNEDLKIFSISRHKLIEYYKRSKVILDVSHPNQTGMSMRVVECYGMNKKLITSNPAIEYDRNVCEIMRLPQEFTTEQLIEFIRRPVVDYKNRSKLSIENWVRQLLND